MISKRLSTYVPSVHSPGDYQSPSPCLWNLILLSPPLPQKYLVPCRAKAVSQEEIHDVVAIFGNIETILAVHQPLLREILHIQEYRWPYFSGLGRLFMKHASEFQSYGDFAENYTMSRTTLSNILENKKHKFREFLEPSSNQLRQLLLGPLRRVAKYASVLEVGTRMWGRRCTTWWGC